MDYFNNKWTIYNKVHTSNYTRVHYHDDAVSEIMVMQVNTCGNAFVLVTQKQFNLNMLDLLKTVAKASSKFHLHGSSHPAGSLSLY
jgi:hypothetical protein